MKSVTRQSPNVVSPESPKPSIYVLKERSNPALGNTVNLVLSFGNSGDSQVHVLDPTVRADEVEEETSEPVCRVRRNTDFHDDICFCSLYCHCMGSPFLTISYFESLSLSFMSCFFPLFLPQPAVPQSSPCKNFWRRCQGLLENTLGSLQRKRKIYRQSANEVNCAVCELAQHATSRRAVRLHAACGCFLWRACSANPLQTAARLPRAAVGLQARFKHM